MTEPKTIHFRGPCPSPLCFETGPHSHPVSSERETPIAKTMHFDGPCPFLTCLQLMCPHCHLSPCRCDEGDEG
jgi:hypothetical protein